MSRIPFVTIAATIGAGMLAAALPAVPAMAAATLKVSGCLQRNHDQMVTYIEHFEKPLAAAKGPVTLQFIGGPEVTPAARQGQAMQRGLVDIIFCPSSYYGGQVPEARLVANTNRSPDELRKNGAMDLLQKAWAAKINARILAWPFWGSAQFFTFLSVEPKISDKTGIDLTGVPMRSNATYKALLTALKAIPVTVSPEEVYTGLQRGVIKGVMWPEGGVVAYGWHTYVKYRIEPGFWRSTAMLTMNLDRYKALSKAERDYLDKAALAFEAASGPALRKLGDIDNQKIFASGVKPVKLTGKAREAYLATAYDAAWEDAKTYKNLSSPLEELKAKLYAPGG